MKRRAVLGGAILAAFGGRALASPGIAADGASFTIADTEFRLADLLAPAGREPFAVQSQASLQEILASGRLDIVDQAEPDRWGRRVVAAAVETADGVRSVQELLLLEGAARVRPESDRARIARLLAAEEEARAAVRGLWRLSAYAVRDAATHRATGAFYLIEGAVKSATVTKGRAFLNFGEDYRTDVTATASSRDARLWAKTGLDWADLLGKRVRLRGYVAWINGPSIEIVHPMQIEVLA